MRVQTWGGGSFSALIKTRRFGAFRRTASACKTPFSRGFLYLKSDKPPATKIYIFVYLSKYGRYAEGGEFERGKRAYLL